MKFQRFVLLTLFPPLISCIFLHILTVFEPYFRAIVGIVHISEESQFPDSFIFTIFFFYFPFLIIHWLHKKGIQVFKQFFGRPATISLTFFFCFGLSFLFALIFYTQKVDKNFLYTFAFMLYLFGLPFLASAIFVLRHQRFDKGPLS
jgi:hypothetical protein